jgi:hypothetical protein
MSGFSTGGGGGGSADNQAQVDAIQSQVNTLVAATLPARMDVVEDDITALDDVLSGVGVVADQAAADAAAAQADVDAVNAAVGVSIATLTAGRLTAAQVPLKSVYATGGAQALAPADIGAAAAADLTSLQTNHGNLRTEMSMQAFGTWNKSGDAAFGNFGGGIVGATPSLRGLGNPWVLSEDSPGVFTQIANTAGPNYAGPYQPFPTAFAGGDALYIGDSLPFHEVAFDINAGIVTTGNVFVWEYWNGNAWTALTLSVDNTTSTLNSQKSFGRDGAICFYPPANWAASDVNGTVAFWIRCRINLPANMSAYPSFSANPSVVYVSNVHGWVAPQSGVIDTLRLSSTEQTMGNNLDTKFFLYNNTTGTRTAELTWTKAVRAQNFTGLNFSVAAGDVISVVCTEDDGGAVPGNRRQNVTISMFFNPP